MAETPNDALNIKREIERTRLEMSNTIGEIQDRLRPDHLLQQAKHSVSEAAAGKARSLMNSAGETAGNVAYRAKGAGEHLAGYAKEHPIRIAVTIGALTWFVLRGRQRDTIWEGVAETSWDDAEEMARSEGRSLRNRVGEYASTAREAVGEYAQSARSGARRASETVRSAASSATTTSTDWVQENPLAAGAIALAVGAAIAMVLPATGAENRAMGETRDRVWQRATQAVARLKKNVTTKVEDAAEILAVETLMGEGGSPIEPVGRA